MDALVAHRPGEGNSKEVLPLQEMDTLVASRACEGINTAISALTNTTIRASTRTISIAVSAARCTPHHTGTNQ
jgi:hypothetical protein